MVVRPDTGGGVWLRDRTAQEWRLITRADNVPTWGTAADRNTGIYEVAIAPSNSARIYFMADNRVFRTDDRGGRFVELPLTRLRFDSNDNFRTFGRKIAVDPINPDVVYVATPQALSFSLDAGQSWAAASVPGSLRNGDQTPGLLVAIDPSSSVVNGRKQIVYVTSSGNGVFVSRDGGGTFTPMAGSPRSARHMVCDQAGVLWITENTSGKNLHVYRGGSWSQPDTLTEGWHSIALNPHNASHVVLGNEGGSINQSFDGGATWTGTYWPTYPAGSGVRVADDIPWLAWTREEYMSNGDMAFDPTGSNRLVFAQGIGVWWSNPPLPPETFRGFTWNSMTRGIEQLVSNHIIVPPAGKPVYFAWDRPVFRIEDPDKFPDKHGPSNAVAINTGWHGDFAGDDPGHIVAIINWWGQEQSGFSRDGGKTWEKFASVPQHVGEGKIGGCIAASTTRNHVWVPSNNSTPYFTRDGGATWRECSIPGVPTSGDTGWSWAYYLKRITVVADKTVSGRYYAYNFKHGVFRSDDGGASFRQVFGRELLPFSGFNAKLYAVPGKTDHLFFTIGHQAGAEPADTPLLRSTDGGATWSPVTGLKEVHCAGFGRPAAQGGYPAVFIVGWLEGVYGIYRSDDSCATWLKVGDFPDGNADQVSTISGDPNEYGRVYVGFGGSGAAYGRLS